MQRRDFLSAVGLGGYSLFAGAGPSPGSPLPAAALSENGPGGRSASAAERDRPLAASPHLAAD